MTALLLVCLMLFLTGCAPSVQSVAIEAPLLAFALMFIGVCAVVCSSVGGVSLVKASRNAKRK